MTMATLIAMGASAKAELKDGETIVFLGDSITQQGAGPTGYVTVFREAIEKARPNSGIKVIGAGIGGHKVPDLEARLDKDVLSHKPNVVVIYIGINDVWHRLKQPHDEKILEAYKTNVGKMVEAAQAAGIRVVLCTPTVIQEDAAHDGNKRLALYCDAIKQLAAEKKCLLADLNGSFMQAIANKPAEAKGNRLTSDGVHMNAAGDWLMAEGILTALGVPPEKIEAAKN